MDGLHHCTRCTETVRQGIQQGVCPYADCDRRGTSQLFHVSLGAWVAPVIIVAVGVSIVAGAFKRVEDDDTSDEKDNKDE